MGELRHKLKRTGLPTGLFLRNFITTLTQKGNPYIKDYGFQMKEPIHTKGKKKG